MNFDDFILELELEGYIPIINWIDKDIAEDESCVSCNSGMVYIGMKKGNSYRAFAVCESCKNWIEF